MALVQRPAKQGGSTTYQGKVAQGFTKILSAEADADLDTIYGAWNGGADTVNISDGAITSSKIAAGAVGPSQIAPGVILWQVSGTALTPMDATKSVSVAPPAQQDAVIWSPNLACRGRLGGAGVTAIIANQNSAGTPDDATKPAWRLAFDCVGDTCTIGRAAIGATGSFYNLATWATNSAKTSSELILHRPGGGIGYRVFMNASTGDVFLSSNLDVMNNTTDSSIDPSWVLGLQTSVDSFRITRAAIGSTINTSIAIFDNGGNLTINGPNAIKASGTTWANPSDIRLKKNIQPYTRGLDAVLALEPKAFEFNGQGGSQDGLAGIGLIADEVAAVMPEMVGSATVKLAPADAEETTIHTLDTTALPLALVNAVKELAARVAALEGRP